MIDGNCVVQVVDLVVPLAGDEKGLARLLYEIEIFNFFLFEQLGCDREREITERVSKLFTFVWWYNVPAFPSVNVC